jgi:hypothetical protein
VTAGTEEPGRGFTPISAGRLIETRICVYPDFLPPAFNLAKPPSSFFTLAFSELASPSCFYRRNEPNGSERRFYFRASRFRPKAPGERLPQTIFENKSNQQSAVGTQPTKPMARRLTVSFRAKDNRKTGLHRSVTDRCKWDKPFVCNTISGRLIIVSNKQRQGWRSGGSETKPLAFSHKHLARKTRFKAKG